MDTAEFITFLYGDARAQIAGEVTVWSSKTKHSWHLPVADPAAVAACSAQLVQNGLDAYYGVCLTRTGLGMGLRGSKLDVVAVPGFWLDVDLRGPGHASDALPSGLDDGAAVIESCPFQPTAIVDSGGGLHAYWLFETPWVLKPGEHESVNAASKNFQRVMINAAKLRGWHVDQTGDIARVLRLPGTVNFKLPDQPRPVWMLLDDGPRFDSRVLVAGAARVLVAVPAPLAAAPAGTSAAAVDLADIKRRLRRLSNKDNRQIFAEILAGRSFAEPGGRDAALQKVASVIAFVSPADADPAVLAELLKPSLEAMASAADDPANPALTLEDAAEKIGRAQSDATRKRAAEAAEKAELLKKFSALPGGGQDGGYAPTPSTAGGAGINYTPDDIAKFAVSQHTTIDGFQHRWIVQHSTAYYVFVGGKYKLPVPKDALLTKLRDDLAPANAIGVRLWTMNKDGTDRKMSVQEIMDTYGVVARQARGSLTLDNSFYDPDAEIFWEALCPPRDITPMFDQQIDTWLRLLGGPEADKLLDWIATIGQLEEQSSALYLSGKAGAGKTLLAHGLARLWTEGGPTELSDIVGGSFNSGIGRCPLVFGDEAMTCTTTDLRRLVGSSVHTLRRKYLPNMDLTGSLRVILADNGARMLIQEDELGGDDLEAVASKFLHVAVGDDPVAYLKSLGGRQGTAEWVVGDRIAAHAIWLRRNRQVTPGGRFLVNGHVTKMTRLLASQGKIPSLICEWIAGYLDRPIVNISQQGTAIVGSGSVLINVDAVATHWGQYIMSERQAFSKTKIGRALSNLSSGTKRVGTRRYHDIKVDLIFEWAHQNLVGDLTAMRTRIDTPLSSTISVVDDAVV